MSQPSSPSAALPYDLRQAPHDVARMAVKLALADVGAHEDPPGSNRGKTIEKFLRGYEDEYGDQYLKGVPWCALAVEYWYRRAYGVSPCPLDRGRFLAGTSNWLRMGQKQGWLTEKPLPGDVALILNDERSHAALVLRAGPDVVMSVDGNSSQVVKTNTRPRSIFRAFVRLPAS